MYTRRTILNKLLVISTGITVTNVFAESTKPEDILLQQIAVRSKTDPLIGAKIGSKEVTQRLLAAMKTSNGVQIESILCALGALAGYACQASVREQAIANGLPETSLLTSVQTKNGETYFFGNSLNKPLAESQYSVWNIAGGGAQKAGCNNLPDLTEIFKYTSSSVGTPMFGKLRIPEKNMPQDLPINYVRALWPTFKPLVIQFCPNPEHWPILFGLSIQEMIIMGKSVIDPCLALKLVMEAATPMSKINLKSFKQHV